MPMRINIQVALCIIAMVVLTPVARAQFVSNNAAMPTGDVWLDAAEWTPAPVRAPESGTADDPDPRSGTGLWPYDDGTPEVRTPSPQIKLDITLTMRRPHVRAEKHRSHRSCR